MSFVCDNPFAEERSNRASLLPPAWQRQEKSLSAVAEPSLTAVIYARYSTDNQKESSIERQVEACEETGNKINARIIHRYFDRGKSGAFMADRHGLNALLKAAKSGAFNIVLVEHTDRLSRSMGDLANIQRTLKFHGVEIYSVARGKLNDVTIALDGILNSEARAVLSARSSAGRLKAAEAGRRPTGPCYGYDAVLGKPGVIVPNEDEANVVKRIFQLYDGGMSTNHIARLLNENGIRSAQGSSWNGSSIARKNRCGILDNPLYCGLVVYGRTKSKKDPDTLRVRVERVPIDQWVIFHRPELAIVDRALFDRVQARLQERTRTFPKAVRAPDHIFAEKLRCAECGSTFSREGVSFACKSYVRRSGCNNSRYILRSYLERCILELLVAEFCSAESQMEEMLAAYVLRLDELLDEGKVRRQRLLENRAEIEAELDATFNPARTKGMRSGTITRLRENFENRIEDLERELDALPPVKWEPALDHERIDAMKDGLRDLLSKSPLDPSDAGVLELGARIRAVIDKISVRPHDADRGFDITIDARPAALVLGLTIGQEEPAPIRLRGSFSGPQFGKNAPSPTRRAELDEMAALKSLELNDEDWDSLAGLLPPDLLSWLALGPAKDPRKFLNAVIFLARTDTPFCHLPKNFGGREAIYRKFLEVVRSGLWADIVGVLQTRCPEIHSSMSEQFQSKYSLESGDARTR